MALIGTIRKHIWIVVVLVALGLGGFILQDMFAGNKSFFGSQQTIIGNVDGSKLDWNQFQRDEQLVRSFLYRNSNVDGNALRGQLWNFFVEEQIVKEEADELGLGVSREELIDLQFGTNLSPVISQRFQDPQTRQVDREQLALVQRQIEDNSLDPNFRVFWAYQENEVIKQRLQSKLTNLVAKAVYTPAWMAEIMNKEQNDKLNLAYVRVPFDDIENSEVTLNDNDFKTYFEENKYKYRQEEETRKVEYLVFEVVPTAEDSANIRQQVADRVQPFAEAENDSLFVENNFGFYNPIYVKKEELSSVIADSLAKAEEGTVIGPYLDNGAYVATKLVDRFMMADSADSRHILRQATNEEEFAAAKNTLDSLKNLIESGAESFDSLAVKFSQDGGSASNGGKYEGTTPGQFVPEYNDVLFITGDPGELYTVRTQYGWHLIEVLKRSSSTTERYKIAQISQPVVPSEGTQQAKYDEAYKITQNYRTLEELKKYAEGQEAKEMITSAALRQNDFTIGELGAGQSSRKIVRWAFGDDQSMETPEVGDVSPEIYTFQNEELFYDNKYVIAGLKSITPEGVPSWKDLRTELEPMVINKKKAEIIRGRINTQDLNSLAANFNTKVDTAANVNFSGGFISGLGAEPAVVATAFNMTENSVSEPIEGNSGVFVIKVLSKTPSNTPVNPGMKKQFASAVRSNVNSRLLETMKNEAEITDNRARFY